MSCCNTVVDCFPFLFVTSGKQSDWVNLVNESGFSSRTTYSVTSPGLDLSIDIWRVEIKFNWGRVLHRGRFEGVIFVVLKLLLNLLVVNLLNAAELAKLINRVYSLSGCSLATLFKDVQYLLALFVNDGDYKVFVHGFAKERRLCNVGIKISLEDVQNQVVAVSILQYLLKLKHLNSGQMLKKLDQLSQGKQVLASI